MQTMMNDGKVQVKILCDSFLMEEVVLHELRQREEKGDLRPMKEYHAQADLLYNKRFSSELREVEFERLHKRLFMDLGFGEIIEKALLEFLELGGVEEIYLAKASTELVEGADLDGDRKRVGVKVRPGRFHPPEADPQGLHRYLRHEFRHVADMLDEGFGHPPLEEGFPAASPAEGNILRERYRTIWDIYVDGRLTREGKETVLDKEGRLREMEALYRGREIPSSQLVAAFGAIWGAEKLTHAEIMEMARDPKKLLQRGGAGQESVSGGKQRDPLPGSLCPLCRFPTFHWADGLSDLPKVVLETIKKDFATWGLEDGACGRCVEVYKATVRV